MEHNKIEVANLLALVRSSRFGESDFEDEWLVNLLVYNLSNYRKQLQNIEIVKESIRHRRGSKEGSVMLGSMTPRAQA